jgi:hypothetical protein
MLPGWIFRRSPESLFGNAAVVAFLLVQACDGVLTYIGLVTLGSCTEGNPIVASLMAAFGLGPGLAGAKLVAAFLCCWSSSSRGRRRTPERHSVLRRTHYPRRVEVRRCRGCGEVVESRIE